MRRALSVFIFKSKLRMFRVKLNIGIFKSVESRDTLLADDRKEERRAVESSIASIVRKV